MANPCSIQQLSEDSGFTILKRGQDGLINRIHGQAYAELDLKPFLTNFGTSTRARSTTIMLISLCMQNISEKGLMKWRLLVVVAASVLLVLVFLQSFVLRGPVGSFSAVALSGSVAVYSDIACNQLLTAVDWGVLWPGEIKNVLVYVRNEGASPLVLVLSEINWTPVNTNSCLELSWGHWDLKLMPANVSEVILTLHVSPQVRNITSFGFNIVFEGLDGFPADLNYDGKVDGEDIALVAQSFGSWLGCPPQYVWNPICDLNGDGKVDGMDISLVCTDFGQSLV
jgi:hypothetical protein